MKNEDIKRLNELYKQFSNDEDYKEYEELSHQAWSENKNARAERSLLGEVNGDRYILLLPNDSELIRCINCKRYNPNAGDNKVLGYCIMLGSNRVPRDGYCAWAKKREDGEEPPKIRIGAFPQ